MYAGQDLTRVSTRVNPRIRDYLDALPNKSEFIRIAIERLIKYMESKESAEKEKS